MSATAKERVDALIEKGRVQVAKGIDEIRWEYDKREDLVVKPSAMTVEVDERGIAPKVFYEPWSKDSVQAPDGGTQAESRFTLTPHSRRQLLDKAGVPEAFADRLLELKEYGLLKTNIMGLLPKVSPGGLLIRHVGGTAKGILSTAYRRMDASPIFGSFVEGSVAQGLVPYNAQNTDTRMSLTFVHPKTYEIGRDVVIFGAQMTTSDYGRGALSINLVLLRIWCANMATAFDILRKVHLGKRYDTGDADYSVLSKKTLSLDNRTVASAVQDVLKTGILKQVPVLAGQIEKAQESEVNLVQALDALKKKGLKKETLERVRSTYQADLPVEVLPAGNNSWRLSNVLSFLANQSKGDDKLDLQEAAYSVLPRVAA